MPLGTCNQFILLMSASYDVQFDRLTYFLTLIERIQCYLKQAEQEHEILLELLCCLVDVFNLSFNEPFKLKTFFLYIIQIKATIPHFIISPKIDLAHSSN